MLRFYEQFSRSSRNLGHFWKFKKKFKLLEHKHIIYHFETGDLEIHNICNLFREKFKFRGFTKAFKNFAKYNIGLSSRNLNISRNKLNIWNLQITRFKTIYDMFVF